MYQTVTAIPSPGTIRIVAMRARTTFAEIKTMCINALNHASNLDTQRRLHNSRLG
jgi:hypothetical protein